MVHVYCAHSYNVPLLEGCDKHVAVAMMILVTRFPSGTCLYIDKPCCLLHDQHASNSLKSAAHMV